MLFNPMTGLGQLQGEIEDVKRKLHSKAESYEISNAISAINEHFGRLERQLWEARSEIISLRDRLQELETLEN